MVEYYVGIERECNLREYKTFHYEHYAFRSMLEKKCPRRMNS